VLTPASGRFGVTIWDWERDELVRTFSDAYGMAFDPTGPRIALVGPKGFVEIRDVESGSRVTVLRGPSGGALGAAFSPDGSRIAVATVDGVVWLFDVETGAFTSTVRHGNRRSAHSHAIVRLRG
jgi:WD40 repeat protein